MLEFIIFIDNKSVEMKFIMKKIKKLKNMLIFCYFFLNYENVLVYFFVEV